VRVIGKTTNSSETSVELDLFEGRNIPLKIKKRISEDVGNYLVEQTLMSSSQSKSPVRGEGTYKPLSKEYGLRKKAEVGNSRPNLEFEGVMYEELDFAPTKNGVEIGVYGERAGAADGHNNLSGKSRLPTRRFLPDVGQTYKSEIATEVQRIIADAIAEETTFKKSQFKNVETKSQLYAKLADIFGPMSRAELNLSVFRSEELTELLNDLGLLGLL